MKTLQNFHSPTVTQNKGVSVPNFIRKPIPKSPLSHLSINSPKRSFSQGSSSQSPTKSHKSNRKRINNKTPNHERQDSLSSRMSLRREKTIIDLTKSLVQSKTSRFFDADKNLDRAISTSKDIETKFIKTSKKKIKKGIKTLAGFQGKNLDQDMHKSIKDRFFKKIRPLQLNTIIQSKLMMSQILEQNGMINAYQLLRDLKSTRSKQAMEYLNICEVNRKTNFILQETSKIMDNYQKIIADLERDNQILNRVDLDEGEEMLVIKESDGNTSTKIKNNLDKIIQDFKDNVQSSKGSRHMAFIKAEFKEKMRNQKLFEFIIVKKFQAKNLKKKKRKKNKKNVFTLRRKLQQSKSYGADELKLVQLESMHNRTKSTFSNEISEKFKKLEKSQRKKKLSFTSKQKIKSETNDQIGRFFYPVTHRPDDFFYKKRRAPKIIDEIENNQQNIARIEAKKLIINESRMTPSQAIFPSLERKRVKVPSIKFRQSVDVSNNIRFGQKSSDRDQGILTPMQVKRFKRKHSLAESLTLRSKFVSFKDGDEMSPSLGKLQLRRLDE